MYAFERFLRLCAGRTGQLLNMSSLAIEVGVDVKTIGSWIGMLNNYAGKAKKRYSNSQHLPAMILVYFL